MGGTTRLTAISRINEAPKADCVTCSDDSASIAIVTVHSCLETKLSDFVQRVLPDSLLVDDSGYLLVDVDGKIVYERDPDMSEDEANFMNKRLGKTLAELGFKQNSRFMLRADLIEK